MLTVGDLGVDSAHALDPALVVRDGGKFLNRYSAGVGNTSAKSQWKLCQPGEIAAAVKAGVVFHGNSEWYETRVTEGRRAGHDDGVSDLAFWRSRGLAKGACIYVSWDAFPDKKKWRRVDAYLKAYTKALDGFYVVGCYAGTPYLRHAFKKGLIRYGWRPNAGSWSNDGLPYQPNTKSEAARADYLQQALAATPAQQVQNGNYWYDKAADENIVLRTPTGSHQDAVAAAAPPPVPVPPRPVPAPKPPRPRPKGGRHRAQKKTAIIHLLRQVIRLVEAL